MSLVSKSSVSSNREGKLIFVQLYIYFGYFGVYMYGKYCVQKKVWFI